MEVGTNLKCGFSVDAACHVPLQALLDSAQSDAN